MTPSANTLELPLEYLLAGVGAILLLAVAFHFRSKLVLGNDKGREGERRKDWSIPSVDSQAAGDSIFHRWDPRIKIVALLFFMFCAASLRQIPLACVVMAVAFLGLVLARIPLRHPWRRLKAMSAFLTMFLVVMPLTAPVRDGDTLMAFSHLPFPTLNLRGAYVALLICLKASGIALLVEPLLSTSPLAVTVQALSNLKVPSVVCQMILLSHRYIYVFQHESTRMSRGMSARGFAMRTDLETLRTVGNFLGMLLVRSFERTQRVYEAMLARGYQGTIPHVVDFHAGRWDWIKGAVWVSAGLAVVLADRWWAFGG